MILRRSRARSKYSPLLRLAIIFLLALLLVALYFLYPWLRTRGGRMARLVEWLNNSQAHPDWAVHAGEGCANAPFVMPTTGYIGFIWGDSFRPGHRHQGLDIFGGSDPGVTAVVAAYNGHLTRLPSWKSSVIVRVPSDPLQPGRQIWMYYTHMADKEGNSFIVSEFPPGSSEIYVEAGTLLGYQGNYSGSALNPTGVHLHFSIVLDDGQGSFRNELEINNTLDPSPYLGLPLNAAQNVGTIPSCDPKAKK